MLRVGLTGGIGSGKSTAAAIFAGHGVPIIDADEIARRLAAPSEPAFREIVQTFGADVLAADGKLDRERLRRIVFGDAALRHQLEAILHPRVHDEIERQTRCLDVPYCIIVIPLLIEANQRDLVDRIVVIDADEDLQRQRVTARGQLPEEQIRQIIAAQLSRSERLRHADDVILNNGALADLRASVDRLHERYLAIAKDTA
ncbi:MAG: dephospho-CoA kinase [Acidiferrobacterales bacterium]|nr:dephospho-CoA kinase [Acidiferrobacterales bacterium]